MIEKIIIDKTASYKNKTVLETDKKINLIYGLNGTGKSTIANYLYKYHDNDNKFSNCSIEGLNDEKILVYTQQFIQDNFYQPDKLKAVFTLSKKNKEAFEEINNSKKEIEKLKEQKKNIEKLQDDEESKIWEIKTKYYGNGRFKKCFENYNIN
ncbi:MAG: AAA family ATPase, partial [Endomicrobium sp.]|nr:AAA family ATPase [Endomicrobium sp.]